MYKAFGTIRYKNDWVVMEAPYSIGIYYMKWVERLTWKKATSPYHGFHTTIVAGKYNKVSNHKNWGKYDGIKVQFDYNGVIWYEKQRHDNEFATYYWIECSSPIFIDIRKSLDLSAYPRFPFHITCAFVK